MTGQDDAATAGADDELELDGLTAADLPSLSLDDLRARRDAAVATETGLSYLRRLVQGPLDMVRGELEHRAGGERSDVAGLVEDLPGVLAETGRAGVGGRISLNLEPSEVDPELESELQRITRGGARTADVPAADDDDLVAFAAELDTLEREVSARRRRLHRAIDVLNGELARRYRTGEATVESALAAPSE
jgi:hypothetical protein